MGNGWRIVVAVLLTCGLVAGCGDRDPTAEELAAVEYAPDPAADPAVPWPVATPAEQGLDPTAVAELYWRAARRSSLYGLLVVKDGRLVAERYFHDGEPTQKTNVQSVTKSYTSALVGIALEQGCLASVDEPMMTYFPELAGSLDDPRKEQITVRHLLQMRAGYPWEEASAENRELLYHGFSPSNLVDVALVRPPGRGHDYSNLSSHLLAVIVARACGEDLLDFAREHLFGPLGTTPGGWTRDWDGYRLGYTELFVSARDMARLGQTYLDGGQWEGTQVVPASWVTDSWRPYTENAWYYPVGESFGRTAYGFQWWIIDAGPHTYYLAWGHGGQQIAVVPELDMVVVVTADPLYRRSGDREWALEKANLNLVADFVAGLPAD